MPAIRVRLRVCHKGRSGCTFDARSSFGPAGFPHKFFGHVRSALITRPKNLIGDETHAESTPTPPFVTATRLIFMVISQENIAGMARSNAAIRSWSGLLFLLPGAR